MLDGSNVLRQCVPEALETIITHMGELRLMFGDAGTATVAAVEDDLRRALAARDGNDPSKAVTLVAGAMERLSELTQSLDPEAATAMRVVIERFRAALAHGREDDARRIADVMREMSGARVVKKDQ